MNLTEKQQRWIKQLEELWNFFDTRLNNHSSNIRDLRLKLLLALTVATHRLIRGFLAQLIGESNDNLQSKLRTLTEAFINVNYILSDENDFRARAFLLDSKILSRRTVDKIITLMEQDKASSMASVSSIESFREIRDSLRQEISEEQNRLGEYAIWPSVEQRARMADLEEYYPTVFYLFSQDNHMSADGLFRFLEEVNGSIALITELDLSDLDTEIQTAYAYYFQFINLCSVWLGLPTEEELTEFRNSEMLSIVPFSTK
jgi:hypothetical protein